MAIQEKQKLNPGTLLAPVPAIMVSCAAEGFRPNIISLAWAGTVCSEPPTIAIGVRPSRHSHAILAKGGDFVVNLPSFDQAAMIDLCGTRSGRDLDKFAATGFTALQAAAVASPLIAECPVNIECRVVKVIPVGSHDLFLGEVVAAHADPGVLTPAGAVDPVKAGLLAYAGGAYWQLRQPVPRR